jgi:hypothetical protein
MRTNQDVILTMENHGDAYRLLPDIQQASNALCLYAGNYHRMSRRNLEKHAAIVIKDWMLPCEISA